MWQPVACALEQQIHMVAPDLPGHGRSPDFGDGDVHDQAMAGVRPLLRPGMHLVGHSFGGTLALRLAQEAPDQVASLTLIEPVLFAAARGRPGFEAHATREAEFAAAYETGDKMLAARVFNRLWGGGIPWAQFPPAAQRDMAARMPFIMGTLPSLWEDCHGMLAPGQIERLTMPVTFLRGADSVPIMGQIHAGLQARLPDWRETVVDGAGHMLVATHPATVAQTIAQRL
jgi:pimeloyl-ACP methyl ester carboxylesterase